MARTPNSILTSLTKPKKDYRYRDYTSDSKGDPDFCIESTQYDNRRTKRRIKTRLAKLKGKTITAWKKCAWHSKSFDSYTTALVELRIAHNTRRMQPKNHKCRAASAKVISIRELHGRYDRMGEGKALKLARSHYSPKFVYRVGETVRPTKPFNDKYPGECASGIHFFLTKEEAINYHL